MNREINRRTYKYELCREDFRMLDKIQKDYETEDVSYVL